MFTTGKPNAVPAHLVQCSVVVVGSVLLRAVASHHLLRCSELFEVLEREVPCLQANICSRHAGSRRSFCQSSSHANGTSAPNKLSPSFDSSIP